MIQRAILLLLAIACVATTSFSTSTSTTIATAFQIPSVGVIHGRRLKGSVGIGGNVGSVGGSVARIASSPSSRLYAVTKKASTKKSSKKKAAMPAMPAMPPPPPPPADEDEDVDADGGEDEEGEVINFRKGEFVSAIAAKTGMTKADSEMALAAVLSVIATEVSAGKRISLPGFGTFKLNYRAARKGRNPKTGDEIDIKASYSPSFSASKNFKEMANPNR